MSDKCLVSFASNGREDYRKSQLALIKSASGYEESECNWTGDYWNYHYLIRCLDGYCDRYEDVDIKLGSYPVTKKYGVSWQHADMPYQFKPFAIYEAFEMGYTKILWCDSTIRIMKDPEPLWELAAEHGILAWDNEGHPLSNWITDYAKEKTGLTDPNAKQIMACCIMFDFSHPKTLKVVEDWIEGSLNNSFHKSTENGQPSRHDQSYLSALMSVNNIEVQPYGVLAYPHYQPIQPTFINFGV